VRVVAGDGWSDARAAQALDDLRGRVDRVYLHIDLDVLDPSEGIANRYSAEGGLSAEQVLRTVAAVADRFDIVAAAITAYEPAADTDGRMAATAIRVLGAVAAPELARRHRA
jgi:arginase